MPKKYPESMIRNKSPSFGSVACIYIYIEV
jgi:hypothetical protein